MPNLGFKLVEVLMGHRKANTILPQFGEHVGDSQRREALKLVDVHEEVTAPLRHGVGPAKSSKPNRRHQQSAQQRRAIFANSALAEVHKKDLALIHDAAKRDRLLGLDKDAADLSISHESAHLVLNGCDTISSVCERVSIELLFPEDTDRFVRERCGDGPSVGLITKQSRYVHQGRIGLLKKCVKRVAQDVLHTNSPCVSPHFLKDFEESGGSEGNAIRADVT